MKVDDLKNNLRLPVIAAPLFIISNPELVLAQCKAGIVGSFPALNARGDGELEKWLDIIESGISDFKSNDSCDKNYSESAVLTIKTGELIHEITKNIKLKEKEKDISFYSCKNINQNT